MLNSQRVYIYIIYIYIYIWVNYNISPTWNKAILGWFPLLTMIPVRENSEVVIKFTQIHMYIYIYVLNIIYSYIYIYVVHASKRCCWCKIVPQLFLSVIGMALKDHLGLFPIDLLVLAAECSWPRDGKTMEKPWKTREKPWKTREKPWNQQLTRRELLAKPKNHRCTAGPAVSFIFYNTSVFFNLVKLPLMPNVEASISKRILSYHKPI